MTSNEHDSALMVHAALDVGRKAGLLRLPVALAEPLPNERRRHFYTVGETHPLSKVYGASRLSAILETEGTPHLTERNKESARYGLRYCDRDATLSADLAAFTSEEAKQCWRDEARQRKDEQHAVKDAATRIQAYGTQEQAAEAFPSPESERPVLPTAPAISISPSKPHNGRRDDTR